MILQNWVPKEHQLKIMYSSLILNERQYFNRFQYSDNFLWFTFLFTLICSSKSQSSVSQSPVRGLFMVRESLKSGLREIKILTYFQLFTHNLSYNSKRWSKITMLYSTLDETIPFKSFSHDKEVFFKIIWFGPRKFFLSLYGP